MVAGTDSARFGVPVTVGVPVPVGVLVLFGVPALVGVPVPCGVSKRVGVPVASGVPALVEVPGLVGVPLLVGVPFLGGDSVSAAVLGRPMSVGELAVGVDRSGVTSLRVGDVGDCDPALPACGLWVARVAGVT